METGCQLTPSRYHECVCGWGLWTPLNTWTLLRKLLHQCPRRVFQDNVMCDSCEHHQILTHSSASRMLVLTDAPFFRKKNAAQCSYKRRSLSWPQTRPLANLNRSLKCGRPNGSISFYCVTVYPYIHTLNDSSRTGDHIPAVCVTDSTVVIPRTWDFTESRVMKRSSRKTNVDDNQCH